MKNIFVFSFYILQYATNQGCELYHITVRWPIYNTYDHIFISINAFHIDLYKLTLHYVIENIKVIPDSIRYMISDVQGNTATPAHSSVRIFNILTIYIVQGIIAASKPSFREIHNCKLNTKITHEYFKCLQVFLCFWH